MDLRVLALIAAGCSTGKPKVIEDARSASSARGTDAHVAAPLDPNAKGDVAVRVEWHDVPVASRESPGRNACGSPRKAAVAPTTTWGIPDVVVVVAIDRKLVAPRGRVVVNPCELAPRVVIAGDSLSITSAIDAPAALAIGKQSDMAAIGKPADATRPIQLPIAGHEVVVALETGVYSLAGSDPDVAWIVTDGHGTAAITDATGQATFRDLPVGSYPVIAWLPPRGGDHARLAKGQVTIAAGALAELTLDLAAP